VRLTFLQAMEEIHKLRAQISNIVQTNFQDVDPGFVPDLKPPNHLQVRVLCLIHGLHDLTTSNQLKILRQLLTAGFIDQVAVRKDRVEGSSSTGAQFATSQGVPYKALGITEDVFIHPSSVLANMPPPEYIVFNEVVRSGRIWLKGLSIAIRVTSPADPVKGVTIVNPVWLPSLGKSSLCSFSKPVRNSSGTMMVIPRFGPGGWELPPIKMDILQ